MWYETRLKLRQEHTTWQVEVQGVQRGRQEGWSCHRPPSGQGGKERGVLAVVAAPCSPPRCHQLSWMPADADILSLSQSSTSMGSEQRLPIMKGTFLPLQHA